MAKIFSAGRSANGALRAQGLIYLICCVALHFLWPLLITPPFCSHTCVAARTTIHVVLSPLMCPEQAAQITPFEAHWLSAHFPCHSRMRSLPFFTHVCGGCLLAALSHSLRSSRSKVLEFFLKTDRIFASDAMFQQSEGRARANIEREIDQLKRYIIPGERAVKGEIVSKARGESKEKAMWALLAMAAVGATVVCVTFIAKRRKR